MPYKLPKWKDPHRKRNVNASYTDKNYCWYYDLDRNDFTNLVLKIKNKETLSYAENDRYGKYLLTICLIVIRWS